MRTTINIDDGIFESLMRITAARSKTEAVRKALVEFVRLKRKEELLALQGNLEVADDLEEIRSLEGGRVDG